MKKYEKNFYRMVNKFGICNVRGIGDLWDVIWVDCGNQVWFMREDNVDLW